jgi:hypothetical protein
MGSNPEPPEAKVTRSWDRTVGSKYAGKVSLIPNSLAEEIGRRKRDSWQCVLKNNIFLLKEEEKAQIQVSW